MTENEKTMIRNLVSKYDMVIGNAMDDTSDLELKTHDIEVCSMLSDLGCMLDDVFELLGDLYDMTEEE